MLIMSHVTITTDFFITQSAHLFVMKYSGYVEKCYAQKNIYRCGYTLHFIYMLIYVYFILMAFISVDFSLFAVIRTDIENWIY